MAAEATFVLHPEAETELDEAFEWYRERDPDVAARFLAEVDERIEHIVAAPDRWPPILNVTPTTHYRLLDRFPYALFYRVRDVGALIVAVAHQKRRPLYWAGRR